MKTTFATSLLCILAVLLSGCASNPRRHASQHTPPHARFQAYRDCYLKPVHLTPPHGRRRDNIKGVAKIDKELAESLRTIFSNVTVTKDESAFLQTTTPSLVIEPVITKMKFISNRATSMRGAFGGSSFVETKVHFRDLASGMTIACPVFYHSSRGSAGVFSWGASDHIMLSRVVWGVSDYITQGTVPEDAIPEGTDPQAVDPSREELARTVPPVDLSAKPAPDGSPSQTIAGNQMNQEELTEIALFERDLQARKDAVAKLTDQTCIAKVACEARDSGVRLAAVQQLTTQSLLENIAVKEGHWKVRIAAVERLESPEALASIAAKDRVRAVSTSAQTRLDQLR
ncbi:MAG: hypothetical protein HN341_11355 [Verrucomicrobia bacterium]|jgi:hypothetical protein|nr:hypothetical protein [Verrucomicrobiota bacterium]